MHMHGCMQCKTRQDKRCKAGQMGPQAYLDHVDPVAQRRVPEFQVGVLREHDHSCRPAQQASGKSCKELLAC